jgi:UDP-N-acetyl-D-galactosamine dehydrogenase
MVSQPTGKYDAIILAVQHKEYLALPENYFKNLLNDKGLLADIKGAYRGNIKDLAYWSL